MSDMKCPVCNKGTVKEFETAPYFVCSNGFCPSYSETDTTEYDILIRTRKALEIIKKEMSKETMPDFAVIHNALKTALEQKDNGDNK